MPVEIIFRPVVKGEIDEIVSYYENQKQGLGILFLELLDVLINRIQKSPAQFPKAHKQICKAILIDFPYTVYFRANKNQVVALAVIHQKRNPEIWKMRK